ncbi:MAG TPA: DNA cytosine methyltransferase [Bryobacteraceae bacterium]|nr:DNA cytosine methyltransferase [Bryobacteraceae bacterium]
MPDFYEFFAGGGMVRAGLGQQWRCAFANDLDHKKSRSYRENWGGAELTTADVGSLATSDLPGRADLAWASFPCQDLSLAGAGAGLKGNRSGTFWPFWRLMKGLIAEGRAPRLVTLENVCGTLNSHDGRDFVTICDEVWQAGYSLGAMVIDASRFVPQSRPRLFIVCVHQSVTVPEALILNGPSLPWHTRSLTTAWNRLSAKARQSWIWWNLPAPPERTTVFADLVEDDPRDVTWFSREETRKLLAKMSEINRAKLDAAKRRKRRMIGGLYRRTRHDEYGRKVQRAEIRFDDVSGCLRTPAGGSSRQTIVVVEGRSVKGRLISRRETARLMGLPDSYKLPENYNEAYHLTGDGVVVPVVRYLAEHLFEPILNAGRKTGAIAA